MANRYVVADTTPPDLIVTSPESGVETTVASIAVTGETEPGAELYVNGMLTLVDDITGLFETTVALAEGDNEIVLVASDSWGNSATVTVTVEYVNLVADLQEQLEALTALLEELTGDTNTSEMNLTALNEEIAVLRDLLNSTMSELEDVSDRLDTIDNNMSSAESDSDTLSLSTALGLIAAVALLLMVAMVLMYVKLRKGMREEGQPEEEHGPPPPPE